MHWSSCGSPGWPRCPVLRADGDLHAPNWEPALEVGRGWGRGGWGQGRAGRQAPGTGRNSCRTLCSQTAAPLRALRPRRQELRPRKPSRAGGWALPLGARPPTTRHAPPPHTPRLHHHSWAPCPGAAWSLGPVQPDRYVAAAPVGSARPPCFLQACPAPATKSTSPAPHPHEVPPPHPGRDRPPRQPAGHGTEQTQQTTPSEKQLNLCASAPSAVLRRPLQHGRPQAPRGDKCSASGTDSELCNQKSLQGNPDFSTSFDVTLICGNVFKRNAHAALLPSTTLHTWPARRCQGRRSAYQRRARGLDRGAAWPEGDGCRTGVQPRVCLRAWLLTHSARWVLRTNALC